MKQFKRLLIIILLITNLFLSGCTGGREINTLGIVISIGIDKSDSGYMVTYQIINNKAIASKKNTYEAPIVIYTETGKNLFEITRKITQQSPRKIYHAHLRTVVLSEDVAKEGIKSILDFFTRDHEYRTDFYFLIAKNTTAKNILEAITPLESVSGLETYNSLKASEKEWAPTKSIKILELVNNLISQGKNSVLTGVNLIDNDGSQNSIDDLKQSNSPKLKLEGLGAFKKDKLVGWLTEDESKGYNYIINNITNTVGYIQYNDQNSITFEVIKSDSKIKVYTQNSKPAINVKVKLKVNVSALTDDIDLTDEDTIGKIRTKIEEKTKVLCDTALIRVKDDLGTDIFGFGEEIHKKRPELWQKLSNDWDNEFVKLPVSVTVKVDINAFGENTKSIFSKGNN